MGDILSQAEIEALLGGAAHSGETAASSSDDSATNSLLTNEQKDILGEIGNISMGTAATTLFALLNQKVWITTPNVTVVKWSKLADHYDRPCVGIRVDYRDGLMGSNVLVLKDRDVRIISNLMMGGDGNVDEDGELTELDLSAIGEAMNQMVGSASTSMSFMFDRKIDIDTPQAFVFDFTDESFFDAVGYSPDDLTVCISFKMEIGTLINSELMQIYQMDFAMDVIDTMLAPIMAATGAEPLNAEEPRYADSEPAARPLPLSGPEQPAARPVQSSYAPVIETEPYQTRNVNVQPAQFQSFETGAVTRQKENIEIIMDVPLEISVELGRAHKKIKEILEFSPGSVIELDKLAGEPIDILVNGKFVAKGEVVVIDENFGIRVTDIISVDKRI
ncbi:MAG: flagellar motor switch phosphatase FliY [Clostridiales bacterium]|nr:flagellar motor switch phosphatase FliY [Clostridiales bacterium]